MPLKNMPLKTLIEPENNLGQIWKVLTDEFEKACTVKRHSFRYVVLSTSNEGNVNSRWVVLRKFTENASFLIYTDARSEKVKEVQSNTSANILFYNDRKKLQVRVSGKVTIHQQNELTKKYWPGVKGASDKAYTTELAPGKLIENKEEGYRWSSSMDDAHFVILEVIPSEIEALQLNGEHHVRCQFVKKDTDWESSFMVP
ncbi:MAG: pyridoxamine 5'-phosphate oxidase [Vicingaceae bacterium]|jgi:pyridoxamine 5'-phosphate oxidase